MTKPGMIITGAAGFLGSGLVEAFQPHYEIFAIDRQAPQDRDAPEGPDIQWFQVDIGHMASLQEVFNAIRIKKEIDLLLHLAGYYDFTGEDHREYQTSNVRGMSHVLELAQGLALRRFIFTSSVAACPFPEPGQAVTEETPPTAPPPYSRSKRAGEEMLRQYQDSIPATIVRLAAIFTDWCEYEPLHQFLQTWFSGTWDARVLGGKGQWAIPYLHKQDLIAFFQQVVENATRSNPLEIWLGSPNGATTHLDLYRAATRSYYGRPQSALYVPKPLARFGLMMRERVGRLTGRMPFERSWMGDYIDLQLTVDASHTHRRLGWSPTPALDILERMPVIIHNMRTDFAEWQRRRQDRRHLRLDERS